MQEREIKFRKGKEKKERKVDTSEKMGHISKQIQLFNI